MHGMPGGEKRWGVVDNMSIKDCTDLNSALLSSLGKSQTFGALASVGSMILDFRGSCFCTKTFGYHQNDKRSWNQHLQLGEPEARTLGIRGVVLNGMVNLGPEVPVLRSRVVFIPYLFVCFTASASLENHRLGASRTSCGFAIKPSPRMLGTSVPGRRKLQLRLWQVVLLNFARVRGSCSLQKCQRIKALQGGLSCVQRVD